MAPAQTAAQVDFMRVIGPAGPHPVGAVFHPVADVQGGGRLEQMPPRGQPHGERPAGQEMHFQRARTAGDMLGGRRVHAASVVVPAPRGEGVVLERLLEEHHAPPPPPPPPPPRPRQPPRAPPPRPASARPPPRPPP